MGSCDVLDEPWLFRLRRRTRGRADRGHFLHIGRTSNGWRSHSRHSVLRPSLLFVLGFLLLLLHFILQANLLLSLEFVCLAPFLLKPFKDLLGVSIFPVLSLERLLERFAEFFFLIFFGLRRHHQFLLKRLVRVRVDHDRVRDG